MPGSVEAALVLIVLAGPGFAASRLLNSLVPYRTPTAFQETTQAVVFSAVMVPVWLLFAKPLLASRDEILAVWNQQQQATRLPEWAIGMPILIFGLVYFVGAPCVAIVDCSKAADAAPLGYADLRVRRRVDVPSNPRRSSGGRRRGSRPRGA